MKMEKISKTFNKAFQTECRVTMTTKLKNSSSSYKVAGKKCPWWKQHGVLKFITTEQRYKESPKTFDKASG